MNRFSRRQFLAGAAAATGAAAFGGRFAWAAADGSKVTAGTDLVALGRTGIKSTVLGIGTGTRGGREQCSMGPDGFSRLLRHGYERGIRYIDTADMYKSSDYKAHMLVRDAIKGLPREEFFIQTKTRAKDAEAAKADIERFRQELGTDYFDSLLMHCMTTKPWPNDMRPVMDVLHEAKAKGIVRAVGVSCHGYDPLVSSSECDWCDVHLVRINPFGDKMDLQSAEEPDSQIKPANIAAQIKKMHKLNHGVIGMKVFGETGFDSPEKRLESLKYVLGLGAVQAFTIGFTSTQQIDETLAMIEKALA